MKKPADTIGPLPDSFQQLVSFGFALFKRNDFSASADALERAALIRPLSNEARITLATAYGMLGQVSLSRDLLLGLATNPSVNEVELLCIAMGFESIDQPRLAMEACRQAGKLAPESPHIHYRMAYYASKCGYPFSTVEALQRHAISLDPFNIQFRIGLAAHLLRVKRTAAALVVVRPVLPDRIEEVRCASCLKMLANLFFDNDRLAEAAVCAERLQSVLRSGTDTTQKVASGCHE